MRAGPSLGVCFHREAPAAQVIEQARAAEANGFDEFWVIEDCFFTSGPALAAAALTASSSITVGIGIMPGVARNAALTAMEIATLCGLAPGRFHAGIGHGMAEWMAQIGEGVASPVTALEETIDATRRLLHGERLTTQGRYVRLDGVELAAPPTPVPLVSAGVRGPKSLAMAGRVADGVILADFCSPGYVAEVRRILATADADRDHRVTVFAAMAVGSDGDLMRRIMAPVAAGPFEAAYPSITTLEFYDELAARAGRTSWTEALAAMPAEWWRQVAAVGTPDDAAEYLQAMTAAGTDCIAVFPDPDDPIGSAAEFRRAVQPLLASPT